MSTKRKEDGAARRRPIFNNVRYEVAARDSGSEYSKGARDMSISQALVFALFSRAPSSSRFLRGATINEPSSVCIYLHADTADIK